MSEVCETCRGSKRITARCSFCGAGTCSGECNVTHHKDQHGQHGKDDQIATLKARLEEAEGLLERVMADGKRRSEAWLVEDAIREFLEGVKHEQVIDARGGDR